MHNVFWTSIENFHTLRRTLQNYPELLCGKDTITYRAKVKLHGTNAGVRIDPDGTVTALSRTQVITLDSDNVGFARWVQENRQYFASLRTNVVTYLFGEWCGPGIQKGTAVNSIPHKIFAVFSVRTMDENRSDLIISPSIIAEILKDHEKHGVYVIPWYSEGQTWSVNFAGDAADLQPVVDDVNEHVLKVEACDPWILQKFSVRGVGEGLVLYPVVNSIDMPRGNYKVTTDLMWKAKGEKHAVIAKTKPVQVDPTVAANLDGFVQLVLTEARLEQGAAHAALHGMGGMPYDMRDMGRFLKWITDDVSRECQTEREAAKIAEKSASGAVMKAARTWFVEKNKTI